MRRAALLALSSLLLPLQALAGSWDLNCDGSTKTGELALNPGDVACYTPTSNTDDSPLVSVSDCENTDWFLFDDYDGDATVCTVAWEIELCPQNTLSGATEDAACEIAEGTSALSGDSVESNIAVAIWARVKGDGAGANASSCRIQVKCAGVNQ